jgi:hypothetical protein
VRVNSLDGDRYLQVLSSLPMALLEPVKVKVWAG